MMGGSDISRLSRKTQNNNSFSHRKKEKKKLIHKFLLGKQSGGNKRKETAKRDNLVGGLFQINLRILQKSNEEKASIPVGI